MFLLSGWRPGTAGDGNDENQLYAIPPRDGQPDENAPNNCGPLCESMIVYWSQNILVSPDEIKDRILGQGNVGYTTVIQLSDDLNNAYGITTQWVNMPDPVQALAQYRAWVEQDNPVIVLTYSNWATKAGGHFELGIGDNDDGGVHVSNPWTGGEEDWTPAMWTQAYNGWLLRAVCGPYPAGPYNSPTDAPPHTPPIGTGMAGRYLVTTSMMARSTPEIDPSGKNVIWIGGQPQMLNHGAVLQGTGRWTPHFREVTAGGHPVWAYTPNLRSV